MSAVPNLAAEFLELERLVEAQPEGTRAEIVRGVYLFQPKPRVKHLRAQGELYFGLRERYARGGSDGPSSQWLFVQEPELRSERAFSRLIPDLAGWRRTSGGWPGPDESLISLPPDFVAEVLSPGNEDADRGPKREAYGLMGVEWMWILDPAERTVEAFENVCGTMVAGRRLGAEDILALPPFEALTLRVEALFAL